MVSTVIENLICCRADLRPSASDLLARMSGQFTSCLQNNPPLNSLESENTDLKSKIQDLESELMSEREKNRYQICLNTLSGFRHLRVHEDVNLNPLSGMRDLNRLP